MGQKDVADDAVASDVEEVRDGAAPDHVEPPAAFSDDGEFDQRWVNQASNIRTKIGIK